MGAPKIEPGIPIPAYSYRGKARRFPIADMAVGDSFLVPYTDYAALIRAAGRARRLGYRLVMRSLENGVRLWRV